MKIQLLTLPLVITSLFTGCSQKVEADPLTHHQEHQVLEAQDWATACLNQQETTMSFLGTHRLTSVSIFADEKCQTLKHNTTRFDDIEISDTTQKNGTAEIQAVAKALKSQKNQDISLVIKDNVLEYTEANTPSLNSKEIKVFLALQ